MMSRSFKIFLAVATFCLPLTALAGENHFSVYDIKKTVPLRDKEKVFRDYYINMGTDAGVKIGSIIAIYRRQATVDHMNNENHDDLIIPVAHVKVIQAGKTMSVARLESLVSGKQIPVLEFNAVMLGDKAELTDAEVKVASAPKK